MYATIFPLFLWVTFGLVAAFCATSDRYASRILIALWIVAALSLSDSPQNLIRQIIPSDRNWIEARENLLAAHEGRLPVRIISLNCMKSSTAVSKLSLLRPDVILLQESPVKDELEELLRTHFPDYRMHFNTDTSMLVRGGNVISIDTETELGHSSLFALVKLDSGVQFHALSLHLIHSPRRTDFWNIETWKIFSELKKTRRTQLLEVRAAIGETIGNRPTIIGGDFNAPGRDSVFETLKPRFRDGWATAGRGWGKTSLNDYPIHRIDQIWATQHFDVVNVIAKESSGSDHRLVIFDAWIQRSDDVSTE